MIKLYIDLNVIPSLKTGANRKLCLLKELKDTFSVIYSTSHISDLIVGDDGSEKRKELIYSDLDYIYDLTDGNCAYIELGEVTISERSPIDLYEERLNEREIFDTDDLCGVLKSHVQQGTDAYDALIGCLNSPLPVGILEALSESESAAFVNNILPGITKESTLADLINRGWQRYRKLTETDAYKSFRDDFQGRLSIKPNQFITKEPFKSIEDIHASLFKEFAPIMNPSGMKSDHGPQWFADITNNYLTLDMHGYRQDKIKVTEKNNDTMRNTIDDGFHAAFASLCDYYITNDERTIYKTKAVYNKLGILTTVYKPQEFEDHFAELLQIPNEDKSSNMINLDFLSQYQTMIDNIKSLGSDTEKVNNIISYLERSNDVLVNYGVLLNTILANQQATLNVLTNNIETIQAIQQSLISVDTHLCAHDTHINAHDTHLTTHDEHLAILSQRIDNIE